MFWTVDQLVLHQAFLFNILIQLSGQFYELFDEHMVKCTASFLRPNKLAFTANEYIDKEMKSGSSLYISLMRSGFMWYVDDLMRSTCATQWVSIRFSMRCGFIYWVNIHQPPIPHAHRLFARSWASTGLSLHAGVRFPHAGVGLSHAGEQSHRRFAPPVSSSARWRGASPRFPHAGMAFAHAGVLPRAAKPIRPFAPLAWGFCTLASFRLANQT